MIKNYRFLGCSLLALCWTSACADPCFDDGLSQEEPANCPVASGANTEGGGSGSDSGDGSEAGPPTCQDGVQNGDETDVDCGGSCADKCGDGEGCGDNDDCESNECTEAGTCGGNDGCADGVQNGSETDVDCGGADCDPCDDGDDCESGSDCISMVCEPKTDTCSTPTCRDGQTNGDETDVDCGGACGSTCDPGEACLVGDDCVTLGCEGGVCNDFLSVDAAPTCANFSGAPVELTAVASGGSGMYEYAWTPDDGTLGTPDQATTEASPDGLQSYTVTVTDGSSMAQDEVVVIGSTPFSLENNCTLYGADFSDAYPEPSITYDQKGTRACELGNNDFGLHLCESVVFEQVRLRGTLEVLDDANDDDMIGLVWGAQDNSHFYSLSWKAATQTNFGCNIPAGILVKRVDAPTFGDLVGGDIYCDMDTPQSEVLLTPDETTTSGWEEGEQYAVTIDYTDTGSEITVVRDSDKTEIAAFAIDDNTYGSGFFGSTTISQTNACVGPLFAECL